jgi:predicted outer membrane repeat protein
MRLVILSVFALLPFSLAEAATIYVPDNYPTIQGAINASVNGDTIIVRTGKYAGNIDFSGKAIVVKSELGPTMTVIDGTQSGWVVAFTSGEGPGSALGGFTIRNGRGLQAAGGGIYCSDFSSPTIAGNIITENMATDHGGGICCVRDSSPKIVNNIISGNSAGVSGGGIYCHDNCSPTITNNTITENNGGTYGGGIALLNSSPTVNNTIVWDNTASTGPEFFRNSASLPVVQYCDIKGLSANGPGNINANPLFGDAASHDYSLRRRSPCINRGSNAGCPGQDIEGDARPWMGTCDMGADEFTDDHGLGADRFSVNASTGGTVYLFLFGGAPNGGRSFLMLGSLSGTAPGLLFPGGTRLPLNYDAFMLFVYQNVNTPTFQNFSGNLSWGSSTAQAVLDTQGAVPMLVGQTMHFAYVLDGPVDFSSNPVAVEVLP